VSLVMGVNRAAIDSDARRTSSGTDFMANSPLRVAPHIVGSRASRTAA
jgi:hypothetical protein